MMALKQHVLPYLSISRAGITANVFTVASVISHPMPMKKYAEQQLNKQG